MTAKPEFWWGPKFSKSGYWVGWKCFFNFQAAIDQLLAPETLDRIVDILANGDFCAATGDERCPAAVDVVIRFELFLSTSSTWSSDRDYLSSQLPAPGGLCRGGLFVYELVEFDKYQYQQDQISILILRRSASSMRRYIGLNSCLVNFVDS